jgi:hypothetical protein
MSADKYPDTVPDDDPAFDTSVAHQARAYNYLLGGKDHYPADREYAEQVKAVYPDAVAWAQANRAYLGRVVRLMAGDAGVPQFLDIGTGIPAPGNTHEVAQEVRPGSRVVYVDFDPVVLAHAQAFMVDREPGTTDYIHADLRNPEVILERAAETLDFTQPVGLLLISILHAIGDQDDPYGIVARLMDALPSGSFLAITHWGKDPANTEGEEKLVGLAHTMSRQQYTPRSQEEVSRFFNGLEIVEPGVVPIQYWRPGPEEEPVDSTVVWLGGVGRKA